MKSISVRDKGYVEFITVKPSSHCNMGTSTATAQPGVIMVILLQIIMEKLWNIVQKPMAPIYDANYQNISTANEKIPTSMGGMCDKKVLVPILHSPYQPICLSANPVVMAQPTIFISRLRTRCHRGIKERTQGISDTIQEKWEELITSTNLTHNSHKSWQTIMQISNDPTTPSPPCIVTAKQYLLHT